MVRIVIAFAALSLLAACAATPPVTPAARAELAPTGKLRAGINFGNVLLTGKDPVTGAPRGIAVDLARELARRLDVPLEIVPFGSAGQMANAVGTGAWDVATPRGREAAARYLGALVEELKLSGEIARAIERNGVRGVSVAPTVRPATTLEIGGNLSVQTR